jgi:hypothetical protein
MKNKVKGGITVRYDALGLFFKGAIEDAFERILESLCDEINNFGCYVVFEDTEGCTGQELAEIDETIKNRAKLDVFYKYVTLDFDNIVVEETDDICDVAYRVPVFVDLHGFYVDRLGG